MIHILARVCVEDLPRFVSVFSTRGAALRRQHASRHSALFAETDSPGRIVILFEWESREAFAAFLADPAVKPAMAASGATAPPEFIFLDKVADFPA